MKLGPIALLVCIVPLISACTQSADHLRNEKYVTEQQTVGGTTVLLNNSDQQIPLKNLQELNIASVNINSEFSTVFDSILGKYTRIGSFSWAKYQSEGLSLNDLDHDLKPFNTLIIQLTDQMLNDQQLVTFLLTAQKNKRLMLSISGEEKNRSLLDSIHAPIIITLKASAEAADFAAQAIFGGRAVVGRLKQAVSLKYPAGAGFTTQAIRLEYTVPEDAGMNVADLAGIDDIVQEAITAQAAPSLTVLVVKDGKVVFDKAYGTHSYIDGSPTRVNDIYDLASITKTSATTLAVMKLYEEQKLKLDTGLGAYIPEARKTDKKLISLRDLMLHQAGLVPYIPFYRSLKPADHRQDSSAAYPTKVADGYFLRKGYYRKVMWPEMLKSKLSQCNCYAYSDLSMYFMKEIVERQSGEPLEDYVQENFYRPLGMATAGFNPRRRFSRQQIIPTENDSYFRKTLLQGYVHDQGAAMAGGVSGHAGLFASAVDLATLYQMLLNRGTYGGVQYFKPETVDMFTASQSSVSRRGLGFDRQDPQSKNGYPSKFASSETYGHTGYTGTCVWVDPKYQLIYIFLSNRVNPMVTEKLSQLKIRERILDVVYEAIQKGQP